jgi:hypothetical protein
MVAFASIKIKKGVAMAITLTLEVDKLTPAQAQLVSGFILAYVKDADSFEDEPGPQLVPALDDPAAAFGSAPAGVISDAGPQLVIPEPPAQQVPPPPPPAAPANNSAILDKAGLPWDSRIHASSKGLNSDGT